MHKKKLNRRCFFSKLTEGALVLTVMNNVSFAINGHNKPNVILCMADDMGWGDTGFNGNTIIKTPNLDEMARAGIRFTRFYSGAPVCSPTRGSCITGRHPYRYGIFFANTGHIFKEEITIAEALQTQNYITGHFGKWHLGTLDKNYSGKGESRKPEENFSTPGMNGFDEWFSTEYAVPTWNPTQNPNNPQKKWPCWYYYNGEEIKEPLMGDDSKLIMNRALHFIDRAVANKQPFLAVIWFHTPHAPIVAGPEYRKIYSDYSDEEQHYYGCISALDSQVGRLRRELRRLGVADTTMLWFCSDNGPAGDGKSGRVRGSTGPFKGRKRSLFEGGIRVPGLLEWPSKVKANQVVDFPCSTSDYFPTTMDVLGFKLQDQPEPIDGISLLPLIEGKMTERPLPIAFETLGGWDNSKSGTSGRMALIDNRLKLITDLNENKDRDFLVDLVEDPGEKNNIAARHPELVSKMKERLLKWHNSCRASFEGNDYIKESNISDAEIK